MHAHFSEDVTKLSPIHQDDISNNNERDPSKADTPPKSTATYSIENQNRSFLEPQVEVNLCIVEPQLHNGGNRSEDFATSSFSNVNFTRIHRLNTKRKLIY